jgi:hypothetical protein
MRAVRQIESYPVPPYIIEIVTIKVVRVSGDGEWNSGHRYATRRADGVVNSTIYPVAGTALPNAAILAGYGGGPGAALTLPGGKPPAAQPAPELPGLPNLKTIASVTAFRPEYAISLAGVESIDGHDTFHLQLRPYGDPVKHPLRDVWADTSTYDIWKVRALGSCSPCAGPTEMTTLYMPAAGTWIAKESQYTAQCNAIGIGACRFTRQRNDVVLLDQLPDWLFDAKEYAQHQRAQKPDYLAGVLAATR